MPRYLKEDDNGVVTVDDGAWEVALRLAMGDVVDDSIDPFEATILVSIVRDFAVDTGRKQLAVSAEKVISDLRPSVLAFEVLVDKETNERC